MALVISAPDESITGAGRYNRGYVYRTSAIAALGGLLFGFDLVIISGTIPFFTSYFSLNEYQTGWAVGCINLGCIAGALLAGKLSDALGRKKLLMICALLFAFTGIGTGWSKSFSLFIFFRLLSGVAVGAAALVCPVYTAEISPAPMRGRMVSFYQLAITFGILLAYLTNYLLLHSGPDNWRWMFSAQAVPALLFFAGLFFVPESPRWHIGKGRLKDAGHTLTTIGGAAYAVQQTNVIRRSYASQPRERFADMLQRNLLLIVLTGVAIAVFSQAGGQNSLFSYAPVIFKQAGIAEDTAFLQAVILGAINFVFTFIAIGTVDKGGRRKLLLNGSFLLFVDAMLLAAAFYFQWTGGWILFFVLCFIAIYAATLGPVTWVILSEIFPNRIRGGAMAVATLSLWLANFFTTASFPVMKTAFGLPATFAFHGAICLLYFLFVRKKIPETKGKSLEEIEQELTG